MSASERYFLIIATVTISTLAPRYLGCDTKTTSDANKPPVRQPFQMQNRMLCINHEGQPPKFVDLPGHFDAGAPSISPDGKWVAFDGLTIGPQMVRETLVANIDDGTVRKITNGCVPRWSADGKRLCITCPLGSNPDSTLLVEYELATKRNPSLCPGRFGDWSPDGKRLVFAFGGTTVPEGGTHFNSKLFLANADGSDAKELADGDWPSWSPDGKTIAYCVDRQDSGPSLWMIDVATRKKRQLGIGFYRAQWAGDGKSVFAQGCPPCNEQQVALIAPIRIWLNDRRCEYLKLSFDNPWLPCPSPDGKTLVFVVNSDRKQSSQ